MTVSEASQLVIQAGSLGTKYGNIFALDMGEPVSILSLAKQLIYLSGHMLRTSESKSDEPSIEIQYIGLQKGEKIHEELFAGENIANTEHPMIMEAREGFCEWPEVEEMLTKLELRNDHNEDKMRRLLMQTIIKRANQNQLDHKVF
jgi:FlaA1/EpsC-like NDP-sugar epimerase